MSFYKDNPENGFQPKEELRLHECPNKSDGVNHPGHYNSGKIEVIDFIEDQGLGFHLGNVVKYISRAGKKKSGNLSAVEKTIQDLEKAEWYLRRYIEWVKETE